LTLPVADLKRRGIELKAWPLLWVVVWLVRGRRPLDVIDAALSRLTLELLNPLKVKSSSLEIVSFRRRKKKKRGEFVNLENIFSPANYAADSERRFKW